MGSTARSALITGSNRNIGRACALALAHDGFDIVVNGARDRDAAERVAAEVRTAGRRAAVAMGDVGIRDDALSLAAEARAAFGRVDVLVNNAAIRPEGRFLEQDEAAFERVIDVGYRAAYWLARALLPDMVAAGWGRIVNFAGMNALQGYDGRAAVSVAKHAAWGLTKSLAREFGRHGVTVNIVSPGPIRGDAADPAHDAHVAPMVARVPVGRLGTPEEVAAAVALLASDAGAFINGQLIQVNGGAQT